MVSWIIHFLHIRLVQPITIIIMIKCFSMICFMFLVIGHSYSSNFSVVFEQLEIDSTEIDSSQININVLKHSVELVCYDKAVAYIDTLSGMVRGMNKSKMGKFNQNGDVRSRNGHLLGKIIGDEFFDANGDFLGSINFSGDVLDMNEMKIGEINGENQIIDANNFQIGEVEVSIDNRWLAAYFFFFFTTI